MGFWELMNDKINPKTIENAVITNVPLHSRTFPCDFTEFWEFAGDDIDFKNASLRITQGLFHRKTLEDLRLHCIDESLVDDLDARLWDFTKHVFVLEFHENPNSFMGNKPRSVSITGNAAVTKAQQLCTYGFVMINTLTDLLIFEGYVETGHPFGIIFSEDIDLCNLLCPEEIAVIVECSLTASFRYKEERLSVPAGLWRIFINAGPGVTNRTTVNWSGID